MCAGTNKENLEPQYFTDDIGEYILDQDGERIERATSVFGLGDPVEMVVFLRSPTKEQVERFYALIRKQLPAMLVVGNPI